MLISKTGCRVENFGKIINFGKHWRGQLALLATLACSSAAASPAQATNYFVSPTGNNKDGLSYATAWSSFDKIAWNKLNPYDRLFIDGGKNGLV